jgi:4-oxalocrotonate tautomerase
MLRSVATKHLWIEMRLFSCISERHTGGMMPYVNIKITREGATAEQKATLIREVTRLLADTLGKNPATTVVVIEEVETDNWGIGGETVTVRRQQTK